MAMTGYDYNHDLAIRHVGKQAVVLNNLGRTALYGEFVYLGGYFGFVSDFVGIANGVSGNIQLVDDSMDIVTDQIEVTNTLVVGNDIYFVSGGSSAAGKLTNVNAVGAVYVGKVTAEQGAGGAQTHVQFRPCIPAVVTPAIGGNIGSVKCERVIIDAATDYSTTGKATSIPIGSTILDVVSIATATASGGTAQVFNGASAVHTAIVMATDQAVTRMAAGVDDTKLVTTAAVTVKTHASGDAGIVCIYYL